jgi:hypothetical protein
MRSPFDSFDEAVSKQGSSTIGRTDFINHAQGMEMAGNANRQQALRRANQYQIEANEAKAEAGMPSSGNEIMGLMGGAQSLFKSLTKPSGAPGMPAGVNFNDSAWTGAQQGFNDFYQSSSFSAGDGGVSAVDSFDTSGIDFGGLF